MISIVISLPFSSCFGLIMAFAGLAIVVEKEHLGAKRVSLAQQRFGYDIKGRGESVLVNDCACCTECDPVVDDDRARPRAC